MTKRQCPFCGGQNLRLDNVSGEALYWKDSECGYSEVTTHRERYDYSEKKFVTCEMKIVRFTKPRTPLPVHMQPEYLRRGITTPTIQKGQLKISEATA